MEAHKLESLIYSTCEELYKICMRNNLNHEEGDYFIDSIIYHLVLGKRDQAYKKMKGEVKE